MARDRAAIQPIPSPRYAPHYCAISAGATLQPGTALPSPRTTSTATGPPRLSPASVAVASPRRPPPLSAVSAHAPSPGPPPASQRHKTVSTSERQPGLAHPRRAPAHGSTPRGLRLGVAYPRQPPAGTPTTTNATSRQRHACPRRTPGRLLSAHLKRLRMPERAARAVRAEALQEALRDNTQHPTRAPAAQSQASAGLPKQHLPRTKTAGAAGARAAAYRAGKPANVLQGAVRALGAKSAQVVGALLLQGPRLSVCSPHRPAGGRRAEHDACREGTPWRGAFRATSGGIRNRFYCIGQTA